MNDSRVGRRGRRVWPRAAGVALALMAAGGLALLATACGSSSESPQGNVTPGQHARLEGEYLSFSRCMRSHGVSDFPDPITGSGDHPGFYFRGGSNSDVNPNDPAFHRAAGACQHILGHQFRFTLTPSRVGKGA